MVLSVDQGGLRSGTTGAQGPGQQVPPAAEGDRGAARACSGPGRDPVRVSPALTAALTADRTESFLGLG